MTNAQKEALAKEALELYEQGINVHVPRSTIVVLFGTVIVANMATVVAMGAITRGLKKFVLKDKTDSSE